MRIEAYNDRLDKGSMDARKYGVRASADPGQGRNAVRVTNLTTPRTKPLKKYPVSQQRNEILKINLSFLLHSFSIQIVIEV